MVQKSPPLEIQREESVWMYPWQDPELTCSVVSVYRKVLGIVPNIGNCEDCNGGDMVGIARSVL